MDQAIEISEAEGPTPATEPTAEAAYDAFVWANLPRNYAGNYIHGMLGMTGFRLLNAPTFIPIFLHELSGSDAIVGLGAGLQQLGALVSPIISASQIEHRKKVMPAAMLIGSLMRLAVLGMALASWFMRGMPLLASMLVLLFLFGIFSGAQRVAFQLLLAKVIPIVRRGRLQAWRNLTGGAIAAVLTWAAGRWLIGRNIFGHGYSVTFAVAFVLTSLGLTFLQVLLREPEPPTLRSRVRMLDRLRDFPALLSDKDFSFFMLTQTLAVAGRLAAPFYVLYAKGSVALDGPTLGLLGFAFLGADTASNLVWGYMGDKSGFRLACLASLALWVGSTVLLIYAHNLPMIALALAGLGAASSGYNMSSQTLVLEFGLREDIAMRLAFSSTAEGLAAALGPLLGGLIAKAFGYSPLLWISAGCVLSALIVLTLMVREPRGRTATA
ncbi:MFS transporter [Phenylobacterium montanum]|uniref:MFS transporter n=1 Tax=Phenylobacterium montanum TaxID=2823693 RepID=A0A975FVE5_9CAUL|nr:MFS transporter [Caulobacter sp. S6]QUD86188.1 MFS transporter [Caulobacter sp. S6]